MQVDEPIKDVAVKMLCGPFKDASLQSKVNKLKSSAHFLLVLKIEFLNAISQLSQFIWK